MRTKRKQQSKRKQQERYPEAWRHLHAAALIKAYERNALEYGRLPVSEGEREVESEVAAELRSDAIGPEKLPAAPPALQAPGVEDPGASAARGEDEPPPQDSCRPRGETMRPALPLRRRLSRRD
jgi:hypothetical protein